MDLELRELQLMPNQKGLQMQETQRKEQCTVLNPELHSRSLLSRMTYPTDLQGLPLCRTKGSIRTYLSSATPSSKDVARGRNPKRQCTPTFSPSSPRHSEMTENVLMPHSSHSLPPLKVTTRNLKWQGEGLQQPERDSAPPALLYRIVMYLIFSDLLHRSPAFR